MALFANLDQIVPVCACVVLGCPFCDPQCTVARQAKRNVNKPLQPHPLKTSTSFPANQPHRTDFYPASFRFHHTPAHRAPLRNPIPGSLPIAHASNHGPLTACGRGGQSHGSVSSPGFYATLHPSSSKLTMWSCPRRYPQPAHRRHPDALPRHHDARHAASRSRRAQPRQPRNHRRQRHLHEDGIRRPRQFSFPALSPIISFFFLLSFSAYIFCLC